VKRWITYEFNHRYLNLQVAFTLVSEVNDFGLLQNRQIKYNFNTRKLQTTVKVV